MNTTYVSSIGPIIARYIDLKQSLGRQYSTECRVLKHLDSFLDANQVDLTVESFARWCCTRQHLTSTVRRNWMRITRNFCLYRQRTEPSCFIPDPLQFPIPHQPIQPHIFTEAEIIRLLDATIQLKITPQSPLSRENYRLALILFYTTGLRRGELIRLTIGDYDSNEHTLLIRDTKFHKSRLIPLSYDGWNEIETLLKMRRKRRLSFSAEFPLIWNAHGEIGSYSENTLGITFRSLFYKANICTVRGLLPRLHDFRHTFAVHALLRWYREGADVQAKLPFLSIYMGHVSIVSTQYYLQFIEELANSASKRFAKNYSELISVSNKGGAI